MAKQAQTLIRDAIQYETKHDFSKSQHDNLLCNIKYIYLTSNTIHKIKCAAGIHI